MTRARLLELATMTEHEPVNRIACTWTPDEDGVYETTCGHVWQFTDGGPIENGQRFCGYCGGVLVQTGECPGAAPPDDWRCYLDLAHPDWHGVLVAPRDRSALIQVTAWAPGAPPDFGTAQALGARLVALLNGAAPVPGEAA